MSHQPPPYQPPPSTAATPSTPAMSCSSLQTPSTTRITRSAHVPVEEQPHTPPDRRRGRKKKKRTAPLQEVPTPARTPPPPVRTPSPSRFPYPYAIHGNRPYDTWNEDFKEYLQEHEHLYNPNHLPYQLYCRSPMPEHFHRKEQPPSLLPSPSPSPRPSPTPPSPRPSPTPPSPRSYPTPPTPTTAPATSAAPSWSEVTRRSRANSISSTSSTSSTSTFIKTFNISGLPREMATPKALELLCRKVPGLVVSNLRVYASGVATISSPRADLRDLLVALSHQVGKPLTISHARAPAPRRAVEARAPTFSCVLRGVQLDVTDEDVKSALAASNLAFLNAWRIVAKASNKPTYMFRITTKSQTTIDHLLTQGLRMFNTTYYAEPSHPPKPQPIQCRKCQKFDHPTDACQQRKPVCGICGASHSTGACTISATPKCSNCDGDHVAFSPRCPERPAEAATPATAAPLKTADAPTPEVQSRSEDPSLHAIIRFLMSSLSNLFPNLRDRIGRVLKPLIYQFFGLEFAAWYSENWLHVSLV